MPKRPLRPIRDYLDLTLSEVEREIHVIERILDGGAAMSQTDYELLELRLMYLQLMQIVTAQAGELEPSELNDPTIVWVPRSLDVEIIKYQLRLTPALYSRVFYRALPESATHRESFFHQLEYRDGYLKLSSLEALMAQKHFARRFLSVHRLGDSALKFIEDFVPRYRAWYPAQPQAERPTPPRPG